MSLISNTAAGILRPDQVGPLVIQPIRRYSTCSQVATVVNTASPHFRLPVIDLDSASAWLVEGDDITPTQPTIGEEVVTPSKVGALVKVSTELANDSAPEATTVVGDGIARSIARKLDQAYFGNTTLYGPSGLLSLADVQHVDGGSLVNLDPFAEAIAKIENVGSQATAFVASVDTVLALTQLKTFSGTDIHSNEPLLGEDATTPILQGDPTVNVPTKRQVLGVNLWAVPNGVIDDGIIWCLDKAKTFCVIRSDVALQVDPSFYFGSDSLAVRATLRVGFGYPHHQAIVKICPDGS